MNQFRRSLIWLAGGGPVPISKRLMAKLLGARELRVREGPLEVVTLQIESITPRRRTLSESYVHAWTPNGELPLARRARLNRSSSARSRAMLRLQPPKSRHSTFSHAERIEKLRQKYCVTWSMSVPILSTQIGSGVRSNGNSATLKQQDWLSKHVLKQPSKNGNRRMRLLYGSLIKR